MADISIPAAIYALAVVAVFILLYEKGKKKYTPYCEALDKEEYPLKALAPVGFATLEMIKRNYESNIDRKLRRQLRELKDEIGRASCRTRNTLNFFCAQPGQRQQAIF